MSTSGTTNIKRITEENGEQNLGMNILTAKDHAEAFLMVETDRAAAFFMDDILLYSLVANSKSPADYVISARGAVGRAVRRDDAARTTRRSRRSSTAATANLYKSGEINAIYDEVVPVADPAEGHQPERARERRS